MNDNGKNINENNNADTLFDAIGDIEDEMILASASFSKKKGIVLRQRLLIVAAILSVTLILFCGAFFIGRESEVIAPSVTSEAESTDVPSDNTVLIVPTVTESGETTAVVTEPKPTATAVTEPKPTTATVTEPKPTTAAVTEPKPTTAAVTEPKPTTAAVTEPKDTVTGIKDPVETSASSKDPSETSAPQTTQAHGTTPAPTLPPTSSGDVPTTSSGIPAASILGNYDYNSASASPPAVTFDISSSAFAVKARVVKTLPDVYYLFSEYDSSYATGYRVMLFETLESLHGENIPHQFYFVLKAGLYTDMSVYDFLLISMEQIGTDGYVMTNASDMTAEAFSLPVFQASTGNAEFGKIIAFTNGIFDESLWQNRAWIFGYQFAKNSLDYLDKNPDAYSPLMVKRGCTAEYSLERIREDVEWAKHFPIPRVLTLSELLKEHPSDISYVTDFKNGVFAQDYGPGRTWITFRRYIYGCETEETLKIDLISGTAEWSDVRYTADGISSISNISEYIKNTAEIYKADPPSSPHVSPEGKSLRTLSLSGWYFKANGKVYGAVTTRWYYSDTYYDEGYVISYYDAVYVLFEEGSENGREISRDELYELSRSNSHVDDGDYGAHQSDIVFE